MLSWAPIAITSPLGATLISDISSPKSLITLKILRDLVKTLTVPSKNPRIIKFPSGVMVIALPFEQSYKSLVVGSGGIILPFSSTFKLHQFIYFFWLIDQILIVASSEQVAYKSLLFGNIQRPQSSLVHF